MNAGAPHPATPPSARPVDESGTYGHGGGLYRIALASLALMGVVASLVLIAMSASADGAGESLGSKLCAPSANMDCEHVLRSEWARIGPLPTAVLGLAYFATLAVWFIGVGLPNREQRAWHAWPTVFATVGMVASTWFVYVMVARLPVWCPWCIACHALNGLIWLGVLGAWARLPRVPSLVAATEARSDLAAGIHPTIARAGVTLVLAGATLVIIPLAGVALVHQFNSFRFHREYLKIANDVDYIIWKHARAEKHEFAVRPTDCMIGSIDAPHTLIVFSDFECAACVELHASMDGLVRTFPSVRCILRHFPMDRTCNSSVSVDFHPNACEASRAAEAFMALTDDPEKRLKFTRALFDARRSLAGRPYDRIAKDVSASIDLAAFERELSSSAVASRVTEDIRQGKAAGVDGTPAMFLDGRRLMTWRITSIDGAGKPDGEATRRLWQALLAVEPVSQGTRESTARPDR
ncbi:MAG: thioredoxin domain-containing protein [Phycisphaerae bacterium]|nr:thioredoxin domain-containing protein [Phycisphaerae bacterium]